MNPKSRVTKSSWCNLSVVQNPDAPDGVNKQSTLKSRLQDANHNKYEDGRIRDSPPTQQQWLECDPRGKSDERDPSVDVRIGDYGHEMTRRHEVEATSVVVVIVITSSDGSHLHPPT